MRQVRTAGILIELDENGNLRLRAPNEPPQATVEHLRQHKRELVQFLEAKVEDAEHGIVACEQKRTSWRELSKRRLGPPAWAQAVPVFAPATSAERR